MTRQFAQMRLAAHRLAAMGRRAQPCDLTQTSPQRASRTSKLGSAAALAFVGILTLGAVAAPPAGAATQTKFYDLAVIPSGTVYAGVPTPVTFTLTNDSSSTQGLGSAELTIGSLPQSAISIGATSSSAWSASFASASSAVVKLTTEKGYALEPGSSVSVSLTITPTAADPITVGSEVKQSNDFSGSGNDFILLNQSGNPIPVNSLSLAFTTQPPPVLQQSVPKQSFSYMCPAVTVQLEGASGPVAADGVTVTITPSQSPSPGLYFGGSPVTSSIAVVTNLSGQAVFGNCSSGLAATNIGTGYFLTATSSVAASPVSSSTFAVVQSFTQCFGPSSCSATVQSSATATQGEVTAADPKQTTTQSFDLSATFGTGLQLACDGQVATSPADPLQVVTSTSAAGGSVTMTFPKAIVNSIVNNGTPQMPVCVGAMSPFAGSSPVTTGGTSPYVYPYEGLLYACDSSAYASYMEANPGGLAICVSSYAKIHGGAETVVISTSSLGDPMFW